MEPTQKIEERAVRRGGALGTFAAGAAGALVVALAIAGLGLVGAGAQDSTTKVGFAAQSSRDTLGTDPLVVDPIEPFPSDPSDPFEDAEWAAYDACMDKQFGGQDPFLSGSFGPEFMESEFVDPATLESIDADFAAADEACNQFLPAEVQAEMALWAEYDACMNEYLGDPVPFGPDTFDPTFVGPSDADYTAADEACSQLLPADIQAEIAVWAEYEACIDEHLGGQDPFLSGDFDPDSLDPAVLEQFDANYAAADEACSQFLPAEVQAEMALWAEYDVCVDELGALAGPDFGGFSVISIDTPDGFQTIDLGSGPATVTITSDGTTVTIDSSGDATVIDEAAMDAQWAEFDEAIAACEPLLPADTLS